MTTNAYNLPMTEMRRIQFLLYDGFELLDLSGPASVFSAVNRLAASDLYECCPLSISGGPITSNAGVEVSTRPVADQPAGEGDTVFIVGADSEPLAAALRDTALHAAIRAAGEPAGRLASVCTGAFLLAESGLGRHAAVTTHWAARSQLARRSPDIRLAEDALYVVDGRIWTSAGVTTGLDMALAMVREDAGLDVMRAVARQLVVYAHRPGKQSQFSPLLEAQTRGYGDFSDLIIWMETNLSRPLGVTELAERAAMSERTFHRKFTVATGETPSRFLDGLRLTRAKTLIETGWPIKRVSGAVGYLSDSAFRAAFKARFGLSPRMHALMNGQSGPAETARCGEQEIHSPHQT